MKKSIIVGIFIFVLLAGTALFFSKNRPEVIACTMEAKICPDGSAVGRTGPKCEFSPCPIISESNISKINKKILSNGIYITPLKVLGDSRCPVDVVCIQAGTVTLRVKLESGGSKQEVDLTIGNPIAFSGKSVELYEVLPPANSKITISDSEYSFEFKVR